MANKHRNKQVRVSLDRLGASLEFPETKNYDINDQEVKRDPGKYKYYNEYQNFLYNRAIFGLSIYPKDEVINRDKMKKIIRVHKKAQTILNIWKQEIVNALSNHVFSTIFPDSPITKELLEDFGDITDELHNNKMPLKSLKITKPQVVERFILEGILPKNFNELIPTSLTKKKEAVSKPHYGNKKEAL